MERDEVGSRRVDPYHLLFQGGQFYLLGYAHERKAIRVFRLTRVRGKVSYATKAEHDFRRPEDFDPRSYADRADWQLGDQEGVAEMLVSERIAWQIERHFGRYGNIRSGSEGPAQGAPDDGALGGAGRARGGKRAAAAKSDGGDRVFETAYSNARGVISWVLGLSTHARLLGPADLSGEVERRVELLAERHGEHPPVVQDGKDAGRVRGASGASSGRSRSPRHDAAGEGEADGAGARSEAAIRPERFARLVTLASILIEAGRAGERVSIDDICERLQLSEEELGEDVNA